MWAAEPFFQTNTSSCTWIGLGAPRNAPTEIVEKQKK
jgi:hypothetical protein